MAYVKKTVQEYIVETEDETVEGFNNNQEDRIASELNAVDGRINGIINPVEVTKSTVSPVTGTVTGIFKNGVVYLKGSVTVTKSGDRIANLGSSFAPESHLDQGVYLPHALGGNFWVNDGGVLFYYGNETYIRLDGLSYLLKIN